MSSRKASGWLRRIFRQDPAHEVESELDHHVEQRVRHYVKRGMDPDSARASRARADG